VWNAAGCAPVNETMPGATTCDRFVDAATLTAARRDLDALAWMHLPSRPWQMPDAEDDTAMLALRAHRGRGAMDVTTNLTMRSATLRFIGTF